MHHSLQPPSLLISIHEFLSPPAGWTVESLQEWGSYMKLAFPSTLMMCFEWWLFEFGGLFAGNPAIFMITLSPIDLNTEQY